VQTRTEEERRRKASERVILIISSVIRELEHGNTNTSRVWSLLDEIVNLSFDLVSMDGSMEIRVVGEVIHVNGLRMRRALENFVAFGHVIGTLRRAGVGVIHCDTGPSSGDWEGFLTLLLGVSGQDGNEDPIDELRRLCDERLVRNIQVSSAAEGQVELPDERERKAAAKRTYAQSLAVTKDLFDGARMGRVSNLKDVKHALHNIVDQVLDNETSLSGLSMLKDYDDYAFTHSVNVCIFCVAMGKRLGLSKPQLYDLGMAALVHDLGMSRIPVHIVLKGAELTDEEQKVMESHTWLGAMSIFGLGDYGEIPFRSMIAAYEHHMKLNGAGYPAVIRPRKPSVFSRIIAVADAFDAATNTRAYTNARAADEVLRELWEDTELGFDPVIVKALINLLGIYPIGTMVILDTLELAIVQVANPDATRIHRPFVRVICGPDGMWLDDPPIVDLAETRSDGQYRRSIIKVTDPERYSIRVSDYFT
jgi:HD-GYP domain-containing protein (c-di-GMP phosphodiesterase class II)